MNLGTKPFEGKRVMVTGGTGSLGKVLTRRLLQGDMGKLDKLIIFSRDEAKQHFMRLEYQHRAEATDDVIYHNFEQQLEFWIGDVRDFNSVAACLPNVDVVINAAALKQVPTCEYFPYEAVQTNIVGAENIVRAIQQNRLPIELVIGVSTDKACKPINTMGMTKAVQERIFIQANMRCRDTKFVCVRYGNVLASRGSVIPLFHDQIKKGGPVTITTPEMTRFLLSLDDAVDTIFAAVNTGQPGDTYVPRAPSALVTNVAEALIGDRNIETKITGIRPGEKIHEIMISEEEAYYAVERGNWYAIQSMLPEVSGVRASRPALEGEYSSKDSVMTLEETAQLLRDRNLMVGDAKSYDGELLR